MCQGGCQLLGSDVNIMKNLGMPMVYNRSFIMSATWNYVLEKEETLDTYSWKAKVSWAIGWSETETLTSCTNQKVSQNLIRTLHWSESSLLIADHHGEPVE